MAKVKDKKVSDVLRLELDYRSAASQFFLAAKEDEDFKNGNQWTEAEIVTLQEMNQNPIVVNVLAPTTDQGVALLTTNKPKFSSTGREDSDTTTGRLFSDLLSYVWDVSSGNQELKVAIEDYYTRGLGYLCAYSDPYGDYGKGEVYIKALDTFEVLVDPNSKRKDFTDAANILVTQILTEDEVKFKYPDFDFEGTTEGRDGEYPTTSQYNTLDLSTIQARDDRTHKKYKVIDAYKKIKTKIHKIFDPFLVSERIVNDEQLSDYLTQPTYVAVSSQETKYLTDPQEVQEMAAIDQQTGGVFHYVQDPESGEMVMQPGEEDAQSIPGSTVRLIQSNIAEFIKEDILQYYKVYADRISRTLLIGEKLYYHGIMDLDSYPIVPFVNRHHRNPYPTSDVRMSKGLQRYINKLRSLIIAHASSSTNTKLLIPEGSVNQEELEREWAKAGTGFIRFQAELGVPIVAGPVPLPNELYKNEADAKKDIEFIFGIFALMHGDTADAPSTFKGTIAIDEMGQRRIKSKKDDIEHALNQLAKVVVQLIQQTYTDEKTIRLLRPNNKPKELVINRPIYDDVTKKMIGKMNDITIGKYDVIVVSGSTLPSNRWARFDYYMELYKAGIIDQVEVLKQTEVADIEGVLNRMDIINQLQQALDQAQSEIKKLSGDLQTAERETKHALMKSELSKWKASLDKSSNAVEHATTIYRERWADELSNLKQTNRFDRT